MGVVCCSLGSNFNEVEIYTTKPSINITRTGTSNNNNNEIINLIIKLQRKYRSYKNILDSKLKLQNIIDSYKLKIISELDKKKLINDQIISESKSEQYYSKLLINGSIKSFMEIINNNKFFKNRLRILEKYSLFVPYYVVTSENEVYKGSWNCNKKYHAYGVLYSFNLPDNRDSRTEGIFHNGLLNGLGRIFFSDGELIKGNFSFGRLNGKGSFKRNDGSSYEGDFYEGIPHGSGKEMSNDGTFFCGTYIAGKKKHGKITWKDGGSYEGFFENDLFNGEGTYIWKEGKIYKGMWRDGKMEGKGKINFVDGSFYEGEFVAGKKNGNGKYVWKKGNYYDGKWKDDKQNGYGAYYKNGKKKEGIWVNGNLLTGNMTSSNFNSNTNSNINCFQRPTLGAYTNNYRVKTSTNKEPFASVKIKNELSNKFNSSRIGVDKKGNNSINKIRLKKIIH